MNPDTALRPTNAEREDTTARRLHPRAVPRIWTSNTLQTEVLSVTRRSFDLALPTPVSHRCSLASPGRVRTFS